MGKSKLLIAIGVFLVIAGVGYFASPSRNPITGLPERDEFTFFVCGWLVASGIGIFLHKTWALWLYVIGALIMLLFMVVNTAETYGTVSDVAFAGVAVAIPFGLPALILYLRRHHFSTGEQELTDA